MGSARGTCSMWDSLHACASVSPVEKRSKESPEKICRETRYPLLYWSTAYRFPVLRVQVLVLRVVGPKSLLSVYPTWVFGYCPTSLGSYNSLLNSPYFYVQKSVGISNTHHSVASFLTRPSDISGTQRRTALGGSRLSYVTSSTTAKLKNGIA